MRIGEFEVDPLRYALSRNGLPIGIERLPMDLLLLLVKLRERVVTRDEIVEALWGKDKFLDVDNGINTAIRKLRIAFGDSPDRSNFIQTIPGKGYRFIAPVDDSSLAGPRIMLAVLPFENLSGDPEQDYFADGLTEETICHLGQMDPSKLGVIARTSSMAYKRTSKSVSTIGKELGVSFILESSFRSQGKQCRITAQLIRAGDQTHVWAESYDRDHTEMLAVQGEVGKEIAVQVQAKLLAEFKYQKRAQTQDAEAYDLYLRGRFHWNQLSPPAILRAIGYFEQAIAHDPQYALAYAALGESYAILPITSDARVVDLHPKALAAATRAVELDCALAEGHASLGAIKTWMDLDWEAAEAALLKAIALNPSYVHAHRWYAVMLSATGRHIESAERMNAARCIDPLSPLMHGLSGALLYNARRDDLALGHFRNALAITPNLWTLHLWIAKSLERMGNHEQAMEEYQRAFDLSNGNTEALSLKGYLNARLGNRSEAGQALRILIDASHQRYVPPYNIAMIFAGLDDKQAALLWLENARETKDARLMWVAMEAKWDCLRDEPRFIDLLRKLELPLEVVAWENSLSKN